MSPGVDNGKGQKVMLGFVVRRCAKDLGHTPTPDEFATWANNQSLDREDRNIFGQAISTEAAEIMLRNLNRLVTVRCPEIILEPSDAS